MVLSLTCAWYTMEVSADTMLESWLVRLLHTSLCNGDGEKVEGLLTCSVPLRERSI